MAMQTQEALIDGRKWMVTQLPGMRAWMLFLRVGKLIAPAMEKMGGTKLSKMTKEQGIGLAASLLMSLEPEDIQTLTVELLSSAIVIKDGKKLDASQQFDSIFQGEIMHLLKVLGFAVKVNFGNFSAALGALGIGGSKSEESLSESEMSDTSAGQPGA